MTIQQQLAALGPSFEVDGVKWRVFPKERAVIKCEAFGEPIILIQDKPETLTFNMNCFHKLYTINAPTPADACRQASAMCRERVAELVGALGMGVKQKAVDFAEWMNENRYVKYWGSSGENCNKWYQSYTPPNRPYYTTEELYNLFINQPAGEKQEK